jgi:hypothetical protein
MRKEMGEWEEMKRNVPIYRFFGWSKVTTASGGQTTLGAKLHYLSNVLNQYMIL